MKPLFALIGAICGAFIAALFTPADWARWVGALVGCFLGFHAAGFLAYRRSSPKSLLAFHGPDSPITRTKSEGEMGVILEQLIGGGLVVGLVTSISSAKVSRVAWNALDERERLACAQILAQACFLKGDPREITVFSESGEVLAKWP